MKKIWIILIVLAFYACGQKGFKTDSGVEVTYIEKGAGEAPIQDSILVMYINIQVEGGEVLTTTSPNRPMAVACDKELKAGDLQDVVMKLVIGDSVMFKTTVKNLFEETYQSPVPHNLDTAGVVVINLKLQDQMSQEGYRAYVMELRQKEMEKMEAMMDEKLKSDGDSIDAILKEQGISAITSETGLRYVITEEGTGAQAEAGDQVTVNYEGRLLDGQVFDSNSDGSFNFPLGAGRVIKGWDEGIAYLKEGGKATLYTPSPLGYGGQAAGPKIKPYSILVFDVELVKVEKAAPEETTEAEQQ